MSIMKESNEFPQRRFGRRSNSYWVIEEDGPLLFDGSSLKVTTEMTHLRGGSLRTSPEG